MTLTPYDRRQLRKAMQLLASARYQADLATTGRTPDPDAALRCAFASKYAAEASVLLERTDRRITRRARQGS